MSGSLVSPDIPKANRELPWNGRTLPRLPSPCRRAGSAARTVCSAMIAILWVMTHCMAEDEATRSIAASHTSTKKNTSAEYAGAIELLKDAIQYEMDQKKIPALSISLVDSQRLIWAEGFGFQDAERSIPATAETVYRVGSISKLFTDIAVMQLVDAGDLDLDAPVQKYLSDFQPKNPRETPITLRQMLSHQSGLVRESPVGNYFDPTEPTLAETIASLNETSLVYPPMAKTKYSNAAIAVVGGVVEKVTSQTHPNFVRAGILDPLDMNASSFVVTPAIQEKLATGWMWTYDGRRFEAPTFLLGTGPAGNMYSSVRDLANFVICLLNEGRMQEGHIVQADTYRQMITPVLDADSQPQSFGLGFHIQQLDGFLQIGHGGAVYGFSTQLEVLPERRLGVVAASSLDCSNGVVRRLADYALRLMLATQDRRSLPTYRKTEEVAPERARQLVGQYRESDGERSLEITEFEGTLFSRGGVLRRELRSTTDDGTIVADDVSGLGTEVHPTTSDRITVGGVAFQRLAVEPPPDAPDPWKGLIGEYGWDHSTLYILEDQGKLHALIEWFFYYPLHEVSDDYFEFPDYGLYHGEGLQFARDADGRATEVIAAQVRFARREIGTVDGETFRIHPAKPIDELRAAAQAAKPPLEKGEFREVDLVEPSLLEPSILLDIRYATTNNFTGAVFYDQPRAFLQRPAAEALVRVHQGLAQQGLGLLIHDAYRPWYVTKMFWEATPDELKQFVANPANGSRHNRGCAVDLTLYDLKTKQPIPMVAGYDEFSPRSYPLYPGGTSRARWYRDVLRQAMEAEGFRVYQYEWWHFDYQDWRKYPIGNDTFDVLDQRH